MVALFSRGGISLFRSSCPVFCRSFSVYSARLSPVFLEPACSLTAGAGASSARMSGIERLQKNAKIAEDLIAEISAKIRSLTPDGKVESVKNSTDELRKEVEKWTEILTMVEIRKGLEPSFYLHYLTPEGEIVPDSKQQQQQEAQNNNAVEDKPTAVPPHAAGKGQEGKGKKNAEKAPAKKDENLNVAEKKEFSSDQPEGGKKQKNKAPAKPKEPAAPAAAEVIDVSRLDLRVGKIIHVERHPEADSLYLEKVDVGEPNPRTVISGLVKHVPIEEMQDRMVVLLCNLKPAKMRGITSEAMVMCASSPDKVEILAPPVGAAIGDVVEFEGYTRNPDTPFMNPKKKIFETVAPDLKTNDEKVACYKGVPFVVPGKGPVVAATLANVNVK